MFSKLALLIGVTLPGAVLLVAAATWQDVSLAAIAAIVSLSGVYQFITLARMKADIAVIHTTTNSLSEKLLKEGTAKATAEATIAERDRVAAIDDKVALAVKDATVKDIAEDVQVVKKDVKVVKVDVKEGFKGAVKKVVDAVIKKKKKP